MSEPKLKRQIFIINGVPQRLRSWSVEVPNNTIGAAIQKIVTLDGRETTKDSGKFSMCLRRSGRTVIGLEL